MDIRSHDQETIIRPQSGWASLDLLSIWDYRHLLSYLVQRDVKTIYRQTVLGVAWALIGPLMTMIVFTFIFGYIAKIPSEGLPYPLFAFSALTIWAYFSASASRATNGLLENSALLTKVYFPRLILLITPLIAGLVNLAVSMLVLLLMMAYFGIYPSWLSLIMVPIFIVMVAITSFAMGLWFSPLNVQFRDVAQGLPFLIQFWMYATPIAYPLRMVPEPFNTILQLNPITHVVNGFRWVLLGTDTAPDPTMVAISMSILLLVTVAGLFWFKRMEKVFADVI